MLEIGCKSDDLIRFLLLLKAIEKYCRSTIL